MIECVAIDFQKITFCKWRADVLEIGVGVGVCRKKSWHFTTGLRDSRKFKTITIYKVPREKQLFEALNEFIATYDYNN